MKNYLNMLLDKSANLQTTLNELTADYPLSATPHLERCEHTRGHHCFGGEFITCSRLYIQADPIKMHHVAVCYRHLGKLRFNAFVNDLTALYGGDVRNIPASIVYAEDQVIDAFADYCVRLTAGDLTKHAMTYEVFLKLYGEGNEKQVPFIDQSYVIMEFFLFDSGEDAPEGAVPCLTIDVQVGKWVNTDSTSTVLMRENIESRRFHDGGEHQIPTD